MKYLFIVGMLLLSAKVGLCQVPYTLELRVQGGVASSYYRITIVRGAKSVKLRYARLDSIRSLLQTDATYQALVTAMDDRKQSATERKKTAQQLMNLIETYRVYRQDSLQLQTGSNKPFLQLLDSIYQASPAQLERKEANRNRIVFDGNFVGLLIKAAGETEKEVYAQSPSPMSHPELYRLLHQSLQLYRQQRPHAFLDTRYTGGY